MILLLQENQMNSINDYIASKKPNEYVCMPYCCIEVIRKSWGIV